MRPGLQLYSKHEHNEAINYLICKSISSGQEGLGISCPDPRSSVHAHGVSDSSIKCVKSVWEEEALVESLIHI